MLLLTQKAFKDIDLLTQDWLTMAIFIISSLIPTGDSISSKE